MLHTPREHLPEGYPLPTLEARKKFAPVWERAFKIHETAHQFTNTKGDIMGDKPRAGLINPIEGNPTYCDCFEKAYQEFFGKPKVKAKPKKKAPAKKKPKAKKVKRKWN